MENLTYEQLNEEIRGQVAKLEVNDAIQFDWSYGPIVGRFIGYSVIGGLHVAPLKKTWSGPDTYMNYYYVTHSHCPIKIGKLVYDPVFSPTNELKVLDESIDIDSIQSGEIFDKVRKTVVSAPKADSRGFGETK